MLLRTVPRVSPDIIIMIKPGEKKKKIFTFEMYRQRARLTNSRKLMVAAAHCRYVILDHRCFDFLLR